MVGVASEGCKELYLMIGMTAISDWLVIGIATWMPGQATGTRGLMTWRPSRDSSTSQYADLKGHVLWAASTMYCVSLDYLLYLLADSMV